MLPEFFQHSTVHRKVIVILAVMVLPVLGLMGVYVTTIRQLPVVKNEVDRFFEVQVQTQQILEQIVDVQYGFRGFVLTKDEAFLDPYYAATENLDPAIHRLKVLIGDDAEELARLAEVEAHARALLQQERRLIDNVRFGEMKPVRDYIASGEGQAALNKIRAELKTLVVSEMAIREALQGHADQLVMLSRYGSAGVLVSVIVMWWVGGRLLARTITVPLATLTRAAQEFGSGNPVTRIPVASLDELGRLARTMENMQAHIARYVSQMEVMYAIGKDVSMIGPDGLEGVLKRIAERAGGILGVDMCLVLLWNEKIGCWNVGAASGSWHDRLRGTVMICEETPVSFQALSSGDPQIVEDLARRPEAVIHIRDRFGGKSLLAVPLRGSEEPFGVLAVASMKEKRAFTDLDVRLAQQFADLAAIAILNAHLYETAQQRGEGLQARLQELERYAADMAHDLKGPARRMAELASLLQIDYTGRFDERADRYLVWIRDNGQQLMDRIEEVLQLARIGVVREAVEPVDPAGVIRDVLKGCAEQLEQQRVSVRVGDGFPRLACNRMHLFQVLDNLVRNAIKFSADDRSPELEIGVQGAGQATVLFVRDNGIGIPSADRERIFEPFERLCHKEAKGTGIGLAIVKKVIEFYEGRVWVESEPGRGTTVFFTLPLFGELAAVEAHQERVKS